jgi:aryl-alcohol dehydrogenase-like predicted oxidoreductase
MRGLDDLVRSGKILYAGLSNFPAWRVAHVATLAALRGWAPLVAIQIEYSLVERTADRELLPMAEAFGLGVGEWSPLGGGLLTGKYRVSDEGRLKEWGRIVRTEKSARDTAIVDEVLAIADETGALPMHIAIAWVLEKGRRSRTSIVPILGPRTREQLDANLGALAVTLSQAQFERLEKVSEVALGVPHEVNRATLPQMSGGISELIDFPPSPVA